MTSSSFKRLIALALMGGAGIGNANADELVHASREVVIAGHPVASQMGLDVLHAGGNAIDAYITTSLALGVAEPGNSGLGGKMVLLYYDARTRTVSSVVALSAAPLKFELAKFKALPADRRERGWATVCTPGLPGGLAEVYKRWGTKPWKQLVEPAADLADKGIVLSAQAGAMLSQFRPDIDTAAAEIYARHGKPLAAGETLRNPDLARTLRTIASDGVDAFYHGSIARAMVAGARARGGCFTLADFENYHARSLEPLRGEFHDLIAYSSPPPLNGGLTLLASLQCLQSQDWQNARPRDPHYIDDVSRVLEQVYPEQSKACGDVPESRGKAEKVLSPHNTQLLALRAHDANPASPFSDRTKSAAFSPPPGTPGERWGEGDFERKVVFDFPDHPHPDPLPDYREREPEQLDDDKPEASTTHLIIIDRLGDIVCCTQSLGLHFGSAVVAPGTGILLNADIGNFSLATPGSVNYIAPGKWPRSTMSPTIFLDHGKPRLAIGSPAGQRIPSAVLQVSLDVLDFNRPLEDAIRAPRFHLQTGSGHPAAYNNLDLESGNADLEHTLSSMSWAVHVHGDHDFYFGSVNAALIAADGAVTAVADQRRTSDANGD